MSNLLTLKTLLIDRLGSDWDYLEEETIMMELQDSIGLESLEKLRLLKLLNDDFSILDSDAHYLITAINICNNSPVDLGGLFPSSMEMAYGLQELHDAFGYDYKDSITVDHVCKYLLQQEGWSKPAGFFSFVHTNTPAEAPSDALLNDKVKAVDMYLEHMKTGS